MANIDEYSRYILTPLTSYRGQETYGKWQSYPFLLTRPAERYIRVMVVSPEMEGRPDLISNAIYGTPKLDWVIIAFNAPKDVLNWPRSGETIEYPVEELVIPELTQ